MSVFDRFFKGKKRSSGDKAPSAEERPARKPEPETPVEAPGTSPELAAEGKPAPDTRPPEERCGITADMDRDAIKTQLAKMFRRYNRLASSLDGDAREEAEDMLDLIVQMREKYLG